MIICFREDCIYNKKSEGDDSPQCIADVITITEELVCDEYSQKVD